MKLYDVGDLVRVTASFTDINGTLTDPATIVCTVQRYPPGSSTGDAAALPAVVRDSVGAYHADVNVTGAGAWVYRWVGTGAIQQAGEGQFDVRVSRIT